MSARRAVAALIASVAWLAAVGGCDTLAFGDYSCSSPTACTSSASCAPIACKCGDGTVQSRPPACSGGCCEGPDKTCRYDCDDHGGWDHDFVDGVLGGSDLDAGSSAGGRGGSTGAGGSSSACSSQTPTLVASPSKPDAGTLVAAGGAVFYGDEGAVVRATLGGTPTKLGTTGASLSSLAIAGGNVYWAEQGAAGASGALRVVSASGGSAKTLLSSLVSPQAVSASTGAVVYAEYVKSGWLWRVPTPSGPPTRIVPVPGGALATATNGTHVAWIELGATASAPRSVHVAKIDGTSARVVASGQVGSLAMDATHLFYFDLAARQLSRVSLTSGAPDTLYTSTGTRGHLGLVAQDGAYLYFTDGGASKPCAYGLVKKMPKFGVLETATIAAEQDAIGLAIDDKYVVWMTSDKVLRAAK
ncbi:MAG: hypothetical protein IT374_17290 [Polyangiaceae bacterium]|nr:hypothetical protein [Polyangiaceae bacterium]